MRTRAFLRSLAALVASFPAVTGYTQGTFQNLGFESASITVGTPPGPITVASGVPGWTVFYGAIQMTQMYYNDISLGASQITLISASDPFGPNAIEGNYGIFLQGGSTATDVSLRQSSLVPLSAASILFKGNAGGPLSLSLGGLDIPFVALSNSANYTTYGGSIPANLAGQVEELRFSVPNDVSGNNAFNLDSIVFSSSSIPEPGVVGLVGSGALLLAHSVRSRAQIGRTRARRLEVD
jgi:hypothetical protein